MSGQWPNFGLNSKGRDWMDINMQDMCMIHYVRRASGHTMMICVGLCLSVACAVNGL